MNCQKREMRIIIREMKENDIEEIFEGFQKQGWNRDKKILRQYLKEQEEGKRDMFIAQRGEQVAGYVSLVQGAKAGPFAGLGLPEIKDFNVFQKYQREGIGSRLLDCAEKKAGEYADTVTLGVGLHYGYGSAQRMYVKRGYIPDGSGVWYQDQVLEQYEPCCNDDDLILYFSKQLR